MLTLQVRLYEELNDHLPRAARKRSFAWALSGDRTVGGLIRSLGIPMPEVDLVLVNGESAGLERKLEPADRVSVFPVFEAFDISPLTRLRDRPLRRPRFLVAGRLSPLARYLRLLGLDTRYEPSASPDVLQQISAKDGRILLSRDYELLHAASFSHACRVRSTRPREQAVELLRRLDLYQEVVPLGRCPGCNTVQRQEGSARLPACPGCGRHWGHEGTGRMRCLIRHMLKESARPDVAETPSQLGLR